MKKRTNHRGHFFFLLAASVVLIQSLPSQGDPKYKPTLQDYHSSRVIAHRSENGAASAPEADEQSAHVEALGDFAGEHAAFGQGATFGNSDSAGTVATGTTGACCLSTPTCSCVANQTAGQCLAAGGVFRGNKSVCANDICGCLTRACCDPAGSCIGDQTRAACESGGNTWHIEASCLGTNPSLPMPMCNIYNVNNCSWDNGQPLNDGGANRSHVHSGGIGQLPRYDFSTADDFVLRGPDSTPCLVSSIRWWFNARPADTTGPVFTPADPPNDFVGMNVTVFASFVSPVTGLDSPAGHGNIPAGADDLNPKVPDVPLGVVYARTFFNNEGFVTYTNLTGTFCDPPPAVGTEAGYIWQADIAIDPPILLNKNTRYWLTVQGLFPFNDDLRETLQTWWMHSQTNTGIRGLTYRTGNPAYVMSGQPIWVPMGQGLVGAPPEQGNQGSAAPCAAVPANTRFDVPFQLNGGKDPVGISNDLCSNVFGNPQNAFDGYNPFDSTGADTDGPVSCAINQDIWFRYSATCDGTLTAELCNSTFDSAVAIYSNVGCPMGGEELACDSVSCGDDGRAVAIVAETADLLIRVGGDGAATGSGVLRILCESNCGIDDGNTAVNNCCVDHSALAPPDNLGCENAACCQIVCSTLGEEVCCNSLAIGWDSECAAVAAEIPPCQCPCAFACPIGAQSEAESCSGNTNGGCNSNPEVFGNLGTLTLGVPKSICGTLQATGGIRDTDWYKFAVPSTASGVATLNIVLNGSAPASVLVMGRQEPADAGAGETFCLDKVCSGANICEAASACASFNDCPSGEDCATVGATLLVFDSIATASCQPTDGLGNNCNPLITCVPHNATYVVVVVPAAASADCSAGDGIFSGVTCGGQDDYSFTITATDDCLDGACCMFDGGCEDGSPGPVRNEHECILAGGTFAGEGTTCEALPPDVDCADVAHGCASAAIIACGETLMIDLTTDDHVPEEPYPCGAAGHDPNDRAWLRFRAPCVDDNDVPGVVCLGPGVACPPGGVCPGPPGTPCFPGEYCDFCPADGLSCVVGTVCSGDDCDDQTGPDKTSVRLNSCESVNRGRDSLLGIYGSCCPISGVCPSGAACDEGTFCGGACGVETPFANSGCSDDDCGFTELLSDICDQNLIEGETYYIQISNWAEPVNGIYALSLTCPCAGACCDGATATCTDDVPVHECPAPMEFHTDEVCANFSPICGLGACCHANGTCTDAIAPNCTAPGDNHFLGTFCSRIVCNLKNSCDFNTGDPTAAPDQANFGFRSQYAQDIDLFIEVADQFNLKGNPKNSCTIGSILISTFHTSHDTVNGCMLGGGAGCTDAPTDYEGLIVTISNDLTGIATGPSCAPQCTESSCMAGPDGDFHNDEGTAGCRSFAFGPVLPEGEPIPSGNYWTFTWGKGGGQGEYYLTLHFQPPIDLEKNQEKWLAITAIMREIAGYSVIWFASVNYNGNPIQIFSTTGTVMFEPIDATPNDMLFKMQGVKVSDSDCAECRLHGDVAELPSVACLIDVDDLLCMLDGFANMTDCLRADIVPCAPDPCTMDADCAVSQTGAVCLNGACRCAGDAHCAALGVLCNEGRQGGRCELVDVDDILSELDAFAGTFDCPAACAPGACVGNFIDDALGVTCRDGDALGPFFVGNGMSETDCFNLTNGTGTYCGDNTICDPDATCPGSP